MLAVFFLEGGIVGSILYPDIFNILLAFVFFSLETAFHGSYIFLFTGPSQCSNLSLILHASVLWDFSSYMNIPCFLLVWSHQMALASGVGAQHELTFNRQ